MGGRRRDPQGDSGLRNSGRFYNSGIENAVIEFKPLMTFHGIRDEVSRVIPKAPKVKAGGVRVKVPFPTRLLELDCRGCNWTMTGAFQNSQGYENTIEAAVEQAKRRWNLI